MVLMLVLVLVLVIVLVLVLVHYSNVRGALQAFIFKCSCINPGMGPWNNHAHPFSKSFGTISRTKSGILGCCCLLRRNSCLLESLCWLLQPFPMSFGW